MTTITGFTMEQCKAYGEKLAETLLNAEGKADSTKRKTILKAAVDVSEDDAKAKAVLEGFCEALRAKGQSDSNIKTRRSEIRAVFDAVGSSLVSKQWQQLDADMSYHAFITLARSIRNETKPESSKANERKPRKLEMTDKQFGEVMTSLAKAKPAELEMVARQSALEMESNPPVIEIGGKEVNLAGLSMLKQIRAVAQVLAESNKAEDAFKIVGVQILDLVTTVIQNAEKANQDAKAMVQAAQTQLAMAA